MTIDLNHTELKLIEEALDAWEKDAGSEALMGGMLGMMLSPRDEREASNDRFKREMLDAAKVTRDRKIASTLLRAKLYGAQAKESEHMIEQ